MTKEDVKRELKRLFPEYYKIFDLNDDYAFLAGETPCIKITLKVAGSLMIKSNDDCGIVFRHELANLIASGKECILNDFSKMIKILEQE